MAAGTKLVLKFDTMSGSKTYSYNRAKPSLAAAQVKNLGQAMIDNGEIFEAQPVRLVEARLVTTNEQEYDLS